MNRTTIMLPEHLKNRALALAKKMHVSLGHLMRESLEEKLKHKKEMMISDPFFDNAPVFKGEAPKDGSVEHDRYLYGEPL